MDGIIMKQLSPTRNQLAIAAGVYAFLLVVFYALIYHYEPFGNLNRLILDSITTWQRSHVPLPCRSL